MKITDTTDTAGTMPSANTTDNSSFILKGDIVYSASPQQLATLPDAWLVCEQGVSAGVFTQLPERFAHLELRDRSGQLIIPGLIDLHTHAPQYAFRGTGMDLELLDWLDTYTFPEEARYRDEDYALCAWRLFVSELTRGATTRAAIFATVHVEATLALMKLLEDSGLRTRAGKVNMDRNAPKTLSEHTAGQSLDATRQWLERLKTQNFQHCKPILTPRFITSVSDELMAGLADIQRQERLPVQSHLSENQNEIAWVRELRPTSASYAHAYLESGLLGGPDCPTIMAHCVHSHPLETSLLAERDVWVAHCPESNTCLSSGIAPIRAFLDAGLRVGLGTDMAGGYSPSILHTIAETIKVSKLRWRLVDDSLAPLSLPEAFYLATRGGGSFFGKVGGFDPGFEFDAVIFDDSTLPAPRPFSLEERLSRLVYLNGDTCITEKYVAGKTLQLQKPPACPA